MDLFDFVLDLIGKGGPILLVPSGLLNQTNPVPLVLFVMDFRLILMHMIKTVLRALCSGSSASSLVPNLLESLALQNWSS